MSYLVAADLQAEPAGHRFRALLDRGGIVQIPGTHNGMAALQAKAAGFEAAYLSGAAMTASMGRALARETWRIQKHTSSTVIMPRSGRPMVAVMAAPER